MKHEWMWCDWHQLDQINKLVFNPEAAFDAKPCQSTEGKTSTTANYISFSLLTSCTLHVQMCVQHLCTAGWHCDTKWRSLSSGQLRHVHRKSQPGLSSLFRELPQSHPHVKGAMIHCSEVFGTLVNCAKMAEPIELLFGKAGVSQRNLDPSVRKCHFFGRDMCRPIVPAN